MKKLFLIVAGSFILVTACNKSITDEDSLESKESSVNSGQRCAAHEVLQEQLKADPSLRQRMEEIESFTRQFIENRFNYRLLPDGTIEIPVVFNVLYKSTAQNLSLSQLQSQIDVLNEDFGGTNADITNVPSVFQEAKAGNIKVRFVLDQVIRKKTNKQGWNTNDAMKKSSQGGIDPTSPATKLNFWVCNLSGGILGYAQFPGGSPTTDGIVCDDNATGRVGTAAYPFDKGRTATHEIGHWINLRHIWGDATCGTDFVNDTPTHNTYNFGCPSYPHYSTCAGNPVEMTMNYMDYTDDACMYMFTTGQASRMLAVFATGGPRNSFAQP